MKRLLLLPVILSTLFGQGQKIDDPVLGNISAATVPSSEAVMETVPGGLVIRYIGISLAATTDPSVTDDANMGYLEGSRWVNVTGKTSWVCVDNTVGAADWDQTNGVGGGGGLAEWEENGTILRPKVASQAFGEAGFEVGDITSDGTFITGSIDTSSLIYIEKASNGSPSAGEGEYWVRTDGVAMFTDENGTDFQLTGIQDIVLTGAGPHALTAEQCYNAVIYVDTASTVQLPAIPIKSSLTIISEVAGTVVIDPNAADTIKLDGTAASVDENIESPGAVGDLVTLTYRAANTWYAASNSWTEATP